jgi:hypothetical protein
MWGASYYQRVSSESARSLVTNILDAVLLVV